MRTLAALTIASAASIMATRPRVSIIPNASPIRPPGLTLRQYASRTQGFIHQSDQFFARDLESLLFGLHVLRYHRTTRLDVGPRLNTVPRPRIEEFVNFLLWQNLGPPQQFRHQRDTREMFHRFHLEKSLVHVLAIAHAAMVAHQDGIVLRDVREHAFGERGRAW